MRFFQKYSGYFRGLRIGYWLYNLVNYKKLKPNTGQYRQLGVKKKVWQSISHSDISRHAADTPWMDKDISEDEIRSRPGFEAFDAAIKQQLMAWPENGYILLPGFFTEKEADAVNTKIDELLIEQKVSFNFTGRKIMDAWKDIEEVDHLFREKRLLQILSFIMGKDVIPFQTINFQKGSEQKPHSDSIHMTTEPLGYLAAAWIALEDVTEGSGQLVYYPGSHRLNYVMSEDFETGNNLWQLGARSYPNYEEKIESVINRHGLEPRYFMAKKGDVFIWHANLLHGGSVITNPDATRRSQVCHYFAKGVLCYHEISQRPAILHPR